MPRLPPLRLRPEPLLRRELLLERRELEDVRLLRTDELLLPKLEERPELRREEPLDQPDRRPRRE